MLDVVSEEANRLRRRISGSDQERVDEYFTSVREVEKQLQMARDWVGRPKPAALGDPPVDVLDDMMQRKKLQLMFDMIHLALVTDSARAASILTFGMHHDLSHHGKEPKKLEACRRTEVELISAFGGLLRKLKSSAEGGGTLLDNTMVLMTSNLRDGNTHWTHNLPVLLAGGGFKHGRHLSYNKPYLESLNPGSKKSKLAIPTMGVDQQPLCNLFASMMQRGGIEKDQFGSGNGTLSGLEFAGS